MSAPKLTPWFPGHIKPVRPGVYERDLSHGPYALWTGRIWLAAKRTKTQARFCGVPSGYQPDEEDPFNPSWRGLAKEPK
jgi:hypothetical protein